jgi:hypothetical protein
MGAKHPQQVLADLGCNKNDFILAATHLVRTGVCKSGPDAIRYIEEHKSNIDDIIDDLITSKQTKIIKETDDETDST